MYHRLNLPHKDLEQQDSKLKCVIDKKRDGKKNTFWNRSTLTNKYFYPNFLISYRKIGL
jgi:hypothetical protein